MTEQLPVDRSLVTSRVMKSLSRLRQHGDMLAVRRSDGTAPIVVSLPTDCVGDVTDWVSDLGGRANVILAERDGFMIWSWDSEGMESSGVLETIDVHHNSTMEMLRLWLAQNPDSAASINVLAEAAAAEELAYQF